MALPGRIVLE
jgi:hypothetical protein